jgi:hypothetical protein
MGAAEGAAATPTITKCMSRRSERVRVRGQGEAIPRQRAGCRAHEKAARRYSSMTVPSRAKKISGPSPPLRP